MGQSVIFIMDWRHLRQRRTDSFRPPHFLHYILSENASLSNNITDN